MTHHQLLLESVGPLKPEKEYPQELQDDMVLRLRLGRVSVLVDEVLCREGVLDGVPDWGLPLALRFLIRCMY